METSGISSPFGELSRSPGQVPHVLLTRSPLGLPQCCHCMDLVRLACVRHAASVRPEPGSNSPIVEKSEQLRSNACVQSRPCVKRSLQAFGIIYLTVPSNRMRREIVLSARAAQIPRPRLSNSEPARAGKRNRPEAGNRVGRTNPAEPRSITKRLLFRQGHAA